MLAKREKDVVMEVSGPFPPGVRLGHRRVPMSGEALYESDVSGSIMINALLMSELQLRTVPSEHTACQRECATAQTLKLLCGRE